MLKLDHQQCAVLRVMCQAWSDAQSIQPIGWHMCFGWVVVSVCEVLCLSDVVVRL